MKYKIQDIKLAKPLKPIKKAPEKRIIKVESKEARDYSWGVWFLAAISIVFLIFSLSLVFSRAKVIVEAKKVDLPVETKFNLTKTGALVFEVASASGEETKTFTVKTTVDFERKAKGQVILYNTTSKAQNLLIETRLTAPDGKIFKTDKVATVPAGSKDKPGSIEVGVTAEKTGEEYNVGLVDLKILGFKGTPKYEALYGRAKTPFAGGLVGKRYALSAEEPAATLAELKTALQEKLIRQIALQTPKDYFVLPDVFFVDTTTPTFESETAEITVNATGKIYALVLNEANFGQELASKNIADLGDLPVQVSNLKDLVFTIDNKEGLTTSSEAVNFTVSGDAKIVYRVDTSGLRERLVGRHRKDFTTILADFPSVLRAELKVLPFWKKTLPANPKNIKITVN